MMRGPRAKRGDVRAAALALLAEGPNGYRIISEISDRSDGVWRRAPAQSTRPCSSSGTRA
jgi:DNA-binding PadR family transcriptional regulator